MSNLTGQGKCCRDNLVGVSSLNQGVDQAIGPSGLGVPPANPDTMSKMAAVKVLYVFFCFRLHKEALKQAAVDPSTGKIDVSILTTGISGAVRKQRADRAQVLLELITTKGKVLVLKYNKLYEEFREKVIEKGEQVS